MMGPQCYEFYITYAELTYDINFWPPCPVKDKTMRLYLFRLQKLDFEIRIYTTMAPM